MNNPTVRIVVERLVLDGVDVPPEGLDALVAGLGAELRRRVLAAEPCWESAAAIRAPAVELAARPPAQLGRALGRAVHTGLEGAR
jgi:hypothetical protein